MINAKANLDDLRGEIDEIDGAIHDLVMRRAALAARIGALKDESARAGGTPGAYLRPGREAIVLRRLAARHSGPFPLSSLVRLWREIMASLLRLQGPFSVAAFTMADNPGYWDLARDHYGSATPLMACQTPLQVLREVADGRSTVGVLPFPEEGEAAPWWPLMIGARGNEPRVIARLPFVSSANGTGAWASQVSALAIACLTPEQTGDDRSLLVVEIDDGVSRARLTAVLTAVGLPPGWQVAGPADPAPGGATGTRLYLIEVEGFLAADDRRLGQLGEALGLALGRLSVIGASPTPIAVGGAALADESIARPEAARVAGRP